MSSAILVQAKGLEASAGSMQAWIAALRPSVLEKRARDGGVGGLRVSAGEHDAGTPRNILARAAAKAEEDDRLSAGRLSHVRRRTGSAPDRVRGQAFAGKCFRWSSTRRAGERRI
jgi:hypothetical protein